MPVGQLLGKVDGQLGVGAGDGDGDGAGTHGSKVCVGQETPARLHGLANCLGLPHTPCGSLHGVLAIEGALLSSLSQTQVYVTFLNLLQLVPGQQMSGYAGTPELTVSFGKKLTGMKAGVTRFVAYRKVSRYVVSATAGGDFPMQRTSSSRFCLTG